MNRELILLNSLYEKLEDTKIPSFSGDDQLDDWIEDLIEIDAFLAGIACSIISGEKVVQNPILEINNLKNNFFIAINGKESKIICDCKHYLDLLLRIHKLVSVLIKR